MSNFSEIRSRANRIVSMDRYNEGFADQAAVTGRGCAFDTLACIYSEYYPNHTLPRLFEIEPKRFSPDLGVTILEFLDFIGIHKKELGYEIDRVMLSPVALVGAVNAVKHSKPELIEKYSDLITQPKKSKTGYDKGDLFGLRRIIVQLREPTAALFNNSYGTGHIEPTTGQKAKRISILEDFESKGYWLNGFVIFKKLT